MNAQGDVRPSPSGNRSDSDHEPVLLNEAISALLPRDGGRYLDGTFGGGGHTRALLNRSAPGGRVLALDLDSEAVDRGKGLVEEFSPGRLTIVHASFADLDRVTRAEKLAPLDGILLDLGLSSYQIDDPHRGFALRLDGPLDMRFDQSAGQSAADLVSELGEHDLAELIWRYGEDRNSRKIAAAVVKARSRNPIRTTTELAEVIRRATGGSRASIHPATRTFQALRIATNRELEALSRALDASVSVLTPGGRLAVISFHSLEDRMVKQFVARESAKCLCPPEQPMCTCEQRPSLKPAGKAIRPSADEIARNPRSRSAILRVSERLPDEESLRQ